MIMQFNLQCPKNTTSCNHILENDRKRCDFKNLPQVIDIFKPFTSLLRSFDKTVEKMTSSEI